MEMRSVVNILKILYIVELLAELVYGGFLKNEVKVILVLVVLLEYSVFIIYLWNLTWKFACKSSNLPNLIPSPPI